MKKPKNSLNNNANFVREALAKGDWAARLYFFLFVRYGWTLDQFLSMSDNQKVAMTVFVEELLKEEKRQNDKYESQLKK